MIISRYFVLTVIAFLSIFRTFGQQIPIGSWRDELPYSQVISVTDAGTIAYAATPYAIFYVDKEDNSVTRMNKINGLSDIGISCIRYNKQTQTVVLTYTNANIDLIRGSRVTNISDIKRKQILGNKTINSIYCTGKYAYLACGFGIVVMDLEKDEISDTYYIGKDGSPVDVLSITSGSNDTIYAATEKGVYKASLNDPNLANFASWTKDQGLDTNARYNTITRFGDRVVVNKSADVDNQDTLFYHSNGTWTRWDLDISPKVKSLQATDNQLVVSYIYFVRLYDTSLNQIIQIYQYPPNITPFPNDALLDETQRVWIGDNYYGMISYNMNSQEFSGFNLSGPLTAKAYSMASHGNNLYIVPGGRDESYVPLYYPAQVYNFDNTNWNNLNNNSVPGMAGVHDAVTVSPDPNIGNHFFIGTWGSGLLEFSGNSLVARWGEGNSTLHHHSASDTADVRVGGTEFDKEGNLWVATSHTNNCLSMRKGNQWYGFTVPIVQESDLGEMVIDQNDQKWVIMRYGNINPYSILVFTDNGTPDNPADDQSRKLNTSVGNGALPGSSVYCMAVDKSGEIWVGTEKGVGVFFSPENVFSGQNFDAQQILVQQGAYYQYLLENEAVTAIAVDGANRKWMGTDRGGVFLFSADGTKEINHFTEDNSPLFSNRIASISINDQTGEVYFGTDKGVISYKSTATDQTFNKDSVYAYPNPVKPGYTGWIAIKGLTSNASVKITDISGVLIYSTIAEGGQAIWNGANFSGERAKTGVYLVFASDASGNDKVVTKILIVN
jgi:hypothetical protein